MSPRRSILLEHLILLVLFSRLCYSSDVSFFDFPPSFFPYGLLLGNVVCELLFVYVGINDLANSVSVSTTYTRLLVPSGSSAIILGGPVSFDVDVRSPTNSSLGNCVAYWSDGTGALFTAALVNVSGTAVPGVAVSVSCLGPDGRVVAQINEITENVAPGNYSLVVAYNGDPIAGSGATVTLTRGGDCVVDAHCRMGGDVAAMCMGSAPNRTCSCSTTYAGPTCLYGTCPPALTVRRRGCRSLHRVCEWASRWVEREGGGGTEGEGTSSGKRP